jgi:hypothetical protein
MKGSRLEKFAAWRWKKLTTPLPFGITGFAYLFARTCVRWGYPPHHESFVAHLISNAPALLSFFIALWLIRVRGVYKERMANDEAEFRHIFGNISNLRFGDLFMPSVQRIIQLRVDTVLTQLAAELNEACVRQQEFLDNISKEKIGEKQTEEMLSTEKNLTFAVAYAKNAFWNAHRSARNFDFKTEKSFKDYL